MNALISAFKDKQKIMFANEGRLLKKSFFGLLILALAFQTGDFGDVIRESMVNAYPVSYTHLTLPTIYSV